MCTWVHPATQKWGNFLYVHLSSMYTLSHYHFALWGLFGLTGGRVAKQEKKNQTKQQHALESQAFPYCVISLNTYRLPTSTQIRCSSTPAVVEQCKERVCASLTEGQGQVQPSAQLREVLQIPRFCSWWSPYKLFQESWLCAHKSIWLPNYSRAQDVQGPGMQRCCSAYEKRGQRNNVQGRRQNLFALLSHVQISETKQTKKSS